MSLNDQFQKFEMTIDSSCKRIEKVASDLYNEAEVDGGKGKFELKISHQQQVGRDPIAMPVEDYLKNFQWDTVHYAYDKALSELGALALKA